MVLINLSIFQKLVDSFSRKFHQVFFVFWLRLSGFRVKSAFIIAQIIICFIFAVVFSPSKAEAYSFKPPKVSSIPDHGGFMSLNTSFEDIINFRVIRFNRNIISAVFSDKAQCFYEGIAKFFSRLPSPLLDVPCVHQAVFEKQKDKSTNGRKTQNDSYEFKDMFFYIQNYPVHCACVAIYMAIVFIIFAVVVLCGSDK
jgi:hypothetical protein